MATSTFRVSLPLLLVLGQAACEQPKLGAGESGCLNGSDCEDGLRCIRGACTLPVSEAADCAAWDDPFEDNDDVGAARAVPLSGIHGLKLCQADEDWFFVEGLLAGDALTLRAVASAGPAPGILELAGPTATSPRTAAPPAGASPRPPSRSPPRGATPSAWPTRAPRCPSTTTWSSCWRSAAIRTPTRRGRP